MITALTAAKAYASAQNSAAVSGGGAIGGAGDGDPHPRHPAQVRS